MTHSKKEIRPFINSILLIYQYYFEVGVNTLFESTAIK